MGEWLRHLPFMIVGFLRTAVRALVGVTIALLALFLAWFTFEFLVHLKDLLDRVIFGFKW